MSFPKDFSFDAAKMGKVGAEEYDSTSDSESDEENAYQRPQTDPLANEFGDFNPRKRRRTGRNAKESAALGIFGSESEDESTGPGGRRWKRKPLRKQGMSFVSSGAKPKNSDDEDDEEDDEEYGKFTKPRTKEAEGDEDEDEDEEEDEDDMRGIGLGFGSSSRGQGLGFVSASRPPRPPQPSPSTTTTSFGPHAPDDFDPQNPLGRGFVPSSAYEPVLSEAAMNQPTKPAVVARPSAFSSKMQTKGGRGGEDKPKFNTNSFGARMMAKMGYVAGQGLGKEGTGRSVIIEANLRPQGAGLGAVKEKSDKERKEERRQARLRGEDVPDSDEEERQAKAAAAAARKKKKQAGLFGSSGATSSGMSTPRRAKPKYMTMDEVKKAAPGLNIPEAFTPILDMTGPGRKLLTSSSGLMTPTSGTPNAGAAAEETAEQAESRKLARRAQNDFMAILEEWQSLQNRKAYAELQAQQEKQELAELEGNLQGHKVMTDAFAQLSVLDGLSSWQQKWTATIAQLKAAADTIPASSLADMKDELASISVAAIHPLFKQALDAWEPLQHPNTELAEDLLSIQNLLGVDAPGPQRKQTRRRAAAASPYETMIYKLWLPHVSKAVRQWNVHDTDRVLSLYETWLPLLPDFVRIQLLEQDIVRKLDDAVAKWEPKRRRHQTQSQHLPHLWLFPWLPHLPSRHLDPKSADGLVAEVKRKFRQLVDVWEFYRGVVPGLQKWRDVLRPRADNDQWRPLVMSHVLPSMGRYVRAQFRVDPADQAPYLEVITGEFQWLDEQLLAAELVGEVMVSEVFPMWHETLYHLLTTPGLATLDQVAQWFQWWAEEVFPPAIQRLPSVTAEFERGLAMINEALDLGGEPERVRESLAPPSKGPALKASEKTSTSSTSYRDDRHRHHRHSHHHHHSNGHHRRDESAATTPAAAPEESEEMSIRHYVEEWCENNDLQFIPERKKVHAQGPLYRITARGDGKGGVLAYFKGLRLYADTKKGAVEIRVDRDEDWAKLLAMAQ